MGMGAAIQSAPFAGLPASSRLASDWHQRGLGLVVEGFLEDTRQSLLPRAEPCAVVLQNHLFGVAQEFGDIPHGNVRALQENPRKRVSKTMWRRLFHPRPARFPQLDQLPAPEVRDHVQIIGGVFAKDEWPVRICTLPDAILEPLGHPGVNVSSGFRGPQPN